MSDNNELVVFDLFKLKQKLWNIPSILVGLIVQVTFMINFLPFQFNNLIFNISNFIIKNYK